MRSEAQNEGKGTHQSVADESPSPTHFAEQSLKKAESSTDRSL